MVGVVAGQIFASSLPGNRTALGALTAIRGVLGKCENSGAAVRVVNASKAGLECLLRKRFGAVEAQALTLKILNLFLTKYHFRARDTTVVARPFGIVVDPSNVCQLSCPGCVHSQSSEMLNRFDWPKATMAESRFARLLNQYGPAAIGVYFCNYGEPLLNQKTPQFIRMAKGYLAATALSTSMSARRFDAEAYVRSGLDLMVLSIDGATQEVYERFRRRGNLALVLGNVGKLVDAKRRLGSGTPVLSWNFLAFQHNAHEIPAAERMARKLGVNVFRVVRPFDVSWDDPEIRPAEVKPYVKRLDWSSISNAPGNWNPFPHDLEAERITSAFEGGFEEPPAGEDPAVSRHTCHWLYKNMVMDANGRILPCCGAPHPNAKLAFGSFEEQTADLFNSQKYREARAFFAGRQAVISETVQCQDCDWDQTTVNIGAPEIRRYFRAADPWFFDRKSLDLLAAQ